MTLQPGEIQFSDNASPALPAGDYRIVVKQKVKLPDEFESPQPYRTEQRMRVTGPHFGLGPEDVVAVYPPAQADGDFSAALCHVILRDPSLPWRIALRPVAAEQETDAGPAGVNTAEAGTAEAGTAEADPLVAPWLAILLLTPDEYLPPDSDELTGSQSVPLAGYLSPPDRVLGPDFTAEQRQHWLAEFPELHCTVIDVTSEAFAAVAPLAAELPYLAHVRDVPAGAPPPVAADSEPPDQQFAVVIGSRLPGGSRTGEYAAHLVSLEGFARHLGDGDGVPGDYTAVRLLSLARWTFTSTTPAAYLADLLLDLKIGVPRLAPPQGPLQRPIELGYVPADYRTRLGERTAAWYRGPCLPVQMRRNMQPIYPSAEAALVYDAGTGMFDVSFATAWQTGRLLALADRAFSSSLLAWIRDHHRLGQLLLERIALFQSYRQLGRGDLLTTGLTGRLIRRLVTEKVAARLAGPDPPLGPPGDPSGLLRHLHRLPGLLSPAEVDDVLRAGEDPHAAVADRIRGAG